MSFWTMNVTHNPMRFEATRAFRRFFAFGAKTTSVKVGVAILGAIYGALLLLYIPFCSEVVPEAPLFLMGAILPLVAIFGFYASIAGERDKRTWDVIRVAPVRESQIVSAKFLGGACAITIVWALGIPFLVATTWLFEVRGFNGLTFNSHWTHFPLALQNWDIAACYFCDLILALTVLAMTILASAAAKRPLNAFGLALGGALGWLFGLPVLMVSVLELFHQTGISSRWETLLCMNPLFAMGEFEGQPEWGQPVYSKIPHITSGQVLSVTMVFCVVLSLICLWQAKRIMNKVDRTEGAKRHA